MPRAGSIPKNSTFSSYAGTASKAAFWTAFASWIGLRAIGAAVTSKWKQPRATLRGRTPTEAEIAQKLGVDV
jgi:hypothetical protein